MRPRAVAPWHTLNGRGKATARPICDDLDQAVEGMTPMTPNRDKETPPTYRERLAVAAFAVGLFAFLGFALGDVEAGLSALLGLGAGAAVMLWPDLRPRLLARWQRRRAAPTRKGDRNP